MYRFTLMPPLPVCFYNEVPSPVCFYTEVPLYVYASTIMFPLLVYFYTKVPYVCFYNQAPFTCMLLHWGPLYLYAISLRSPLPECFYTEVPFTCMLFAVLWVRTCLDRSSVNSPSSMLIFSTSSTRFFIKMFFLALSIIKVHPWWSNSN